LIPFDSPDGKWLRGLAPSRAALIALCETAVAENADPWFEWAIGELTRLDASSVDLAALRLMRATRDRDVIVEHTLTTFLRDLPDRDRTAPHVQRALAAISPS
jgi:hypothetical protein